MDKLKKQQAFEYLLTQLLAWGAEMEPAVPIFTFTRLKALKLLFFAAAVKNEEGRDLLDVFDNFFALPNGPVESDIYNCITSDGLTYYTFKDFSLMKKNAYMDADLDNAIKERIIKSVRALRMINENIVSYRAIELVALSHLWYSWQKSIQMAKALGKGSYRMEENTIRSNTQIFAL